ncbi:ubiquitin carboxyl-terminal hydrolase [Durotheca rogersii]|uniref:ubiquitin carboxyl-terminal hydrolase n=1 Tax=Durotheca rogersii TaxID=419775 RepID=UPI002221294B|nr:ubiquitin carboxyl-terminal hydrolase [Durotheca rogersii]KAI5868275.1 ubiquitin carboxyl-terminal hydrolase [Durotheca rogersii]
MSTTTNPDPSPGALAFIPLEANPELMTGLLHRLGLSQALQVHDVYSITEPELLAFVPRPALALLLVFPVSAVYESSRLAEDAGVPDYSGKGPDEPVFWFKQTIRNACGLMGLLHAVSNGPAKNFIEPDTPLAKFLSTAIPLAPAERSTLLERAPEFAAAHRDAAEQGATAAPDARDNVDLHYVCFVRTEDSGSEGGSGNGTLWELDGRRKGPIARGTLGPGEDVLSEKALLWGPLKFLERGGGDMRFSCVALASALD